MSMRRRQGRYPCGLMLVLWQPFSTGSAYWGLELPDVTVSKVEEGDNAVPCTLVDLKGGGMVESSRPPIWSRADLGGA